MMAVNLDRLHVAICAANLRVWCASRFPASRAPHPPLFLQALLNTGHHQGLAMPMPSPSRKILGSLDRSNMHLSFLEFVRGHLGLAQQPVPSRAYRNRSPKVTKGRSHQLRSYRCEPTAQCKQLPDTGRQYTTAERKVFHQQQETTRRQQRHARLLDQRCVRRHCQMAVGNTGNTARMPW